MPEAGVGEHRKERERKDDGSQRGLTVNKDTLERGRDKDLPTARGTVTDASAAQGRQSVVLSSLCVVSDGHQTHPGITP